MTSNIESKFETMIGSSVYRRFHESIDVSSQDHYSSINDRSITVISGDKWILEVNNTAPVELRVGQHYFIKRNTLYRLVNGTNTLILEVIEEE